jgi:hypothetical protein
VSRQRDFGFVPAPWEPTGIPWLCLFSLKSLYSQDAWSDPRSLELPKRNGKRKVTDLSGFSPVLRDIARHSGFRGPVVSTQCKRLTNTPVRGPGSLFKCRDDRREEIARAETTYACGSSATGGGVCEQRHAAQRVLPQSGLSFGTLNRVSAGHFSSEPARGQFFHRRRQGRLRADQGSRRRVHHAAHRRDWLDHCDAERHQRQPELC